MNFVLSKNSVVHFTEVSAVRSTKTAASLFSRIKSLGQRVKLWAHACADCDDAGVSPNTSAGFPTLNSESGAFARQARLGCLLILRQDSCPLSYGYHLCQT